MSLSETNTKIFKNSVFKCTYLGPHVKCIVIKNVLVDMEMLCFRKISFSKSMSDLINLR